jgi:hypothetical protein
MLIKKLRKTARIFSLHFKWNSNYLVTVHFKFLATSVSFHSVAVYMPVPSEKDWMQVSAACFKRTDFPNCVGSLDGKQCRIKRPSKVGSFLYNSKTVPFACSDCTFICVDDSCVFWNSVFGRAVFQNFPDDEFKFPDCKSATPLVIVVDVATLCVNLIRLCPGWNNFQLQAGQATTNRRVFFQTVD